MQKIVNLSAANQPLSDAENSQPIRCQPLSDAENSLNLSAANRYPMQKIAWGYPQEKKPGFCGQYQELSVFSDKETRFLDS